MKSHNALISIHTTLRALLAAALWLTATLPLRAATFVPSGDTDITQHSGLGGADSNHSGDAKLWAVGTSTFLSFPLYQFDLSSLAGATVAGNATLSLYVDAGGFGLDAPRAVSVYEVLIGWNAATVTYNSFGATAGVQFGTDTGASSLDSQTIGFTGMTPQYVSWSIPAATVQNWIDNPSQNHGLLIRNAAGANRDLRFESVEGTNQPQLSVTAPEPGALSLLLIAAAGFSIRRRRSQ